MNAGVSENLHPREFMEIVKAVEVLDFQNKIHIFPKDKLTWSYRHCSGWGDGIVTRALISWPLEIVPDIKNTVKELNSLRMKKQPLEFPSCGSVFRNPLPESAGALIERAGLKGRTHGGAQISLKHGNFIVNRGHATCRDIVTLMNVCTSEVKEKFGVDLKSEVVMMGPMPK
jgi:UDP-N-acetylmuramate dehydrogenase